MSDDKIYDVPAEWKQRGYVDDAKYQEMYARSIKDPNGFWGEQAKRIDWIRPFSKVKNASYVGNVSIKWFEDGTLNAAYNCVDRHLPKRAKQTAIIWEGDDPKDSKHITYQELHDEVCRMANILRNRNVKKGDRVTIYMPMIPEAAYAMLACARLGAIHSVVFGGFSPELARQSHRGLQVERRHHRRRRRPRWPQDSAQGQHRRGDQEGRRRRSRHCRQAHRRRGQHGAGARRLVPRGRQDGDRGVPMRGDERGGPAVHPLHVGLDRQTEGRAAHHRRLHGLHVDHAPVRVRLSRRRHLLVHRRRRLGHRPQLHRLRPAFERRHHADVRRRAELSQHVALLGGLRQAQGQHLLHRADRDPRADAGR